MGKVLEFPDISSVLNPLTSNGGERDYSVNMSGNLETGETLNTIDVSSDDITVLTISSDAIDADNITVNFHVTIVADTTAKLAIINIAFKGSSGSRDTHRIKQPIVDYLIE